MAESTLARLAGLGLVRGHGDGEPLLAGHRRRDRRGARGGRGDSRPGAEAGARATRVVARGESAAARLKDGYSTGVRRLAARWIVSLARTRITPDALTVLGLSICAAASVCVYFENRNELLWYWTGAALFWAGSLLDVLDGALARESGKGTPFGAFLDSTTDRLGEAVMLGAIGLVFARDSDEIALGAVFAAMAGSFLVSY